RLAHRLDICGLGGPADAGDRGRYAVARSRDRLGRQMARKIDASEAAMRDTRAREDRGLAGDDEFHQWPSALGSVRQHPAPALDRIEADIPECLAAEPLRRESEAGKLVTPAFAGFLGKQPEPLDRRPADLGLIRRKMKVG